MSSYQIPIIFILNETDLYDVQYVLCQNAAKRRSSSVKYHTIDYPPIDKQPYFIEL